MSRAWRIVPLVRLLVLLVAWCLSRSSFAAITVDTPNVSSAIPANAASLTWSHTVGAGTDRILIVGTSFRGPRPSPSPTAARPSTRSSPQQARATRTARCGTCWHHRREPPPSSSTLTPAERIVGGAVTLFGVDQAAPLGTYVSATGTGSPASVTATSAAGELVIDTVAAQGNAGTLAAAVGQTALWNTGTGTAGADILGGGSTKAGAASVVMSWTVGGNNRPWAIGAVPLRPVPVSGSVFEDVNYGGGAGRDRATASGVPLARRAGRAVRRGGQTSSRPRPPTPRATTRSTASPPATTRCAWSTRP